MGIQEVVVAVGVVVNAGTRFMGTFRVHWEVVDKSQRDGGINGVWEKVN